MTRTLPTIGLAVVALVAGFAVSSPTAALFDAVNKPSEDKDKDQVPDEIEKQLCGRDLVRSMILAQTPLLGRCNATDWLPAREVVVADIPTGYKLGLDIDRDGLPTHVDLTMTRVDINPFRADYVRLLPTTTVVPVQLDSLFSDNDPNAPVVSKIEVPVELPTAVVQGKDKDFDALPGEIILTTSKVFFDRRAAMPLTFEAASQKPVPVDLFDDDASMPVVSVVTVPVLTGAWHDGDGDNDLLPHALKFQWLDVTIDRRTTAAQATTMKVRTHNVLVDENDANRNSIVPFSLIDQDGDIYPDEVEKVVCLVQDEFDSLDGRCVGVDGKGEDGSGENYVAPKGVPNPWAIGAP
ncbi:MAG TPA: hypothetical protein VI818_03545 [Candidatus Thermoplasmatota archaeon]|nr:hypothetical protein [Candidatus Thermoplasmatota archaeon]